MSQWFNHPRASDKEGGLNLYILLTSIRTLRLLPINLDNTVSEENCPFSYTHISTSVHVRTRLHPANGDGSAKILPLLIQFLYRVQRVPSPIPKPTTPSTGSDDGDILR